MNIPKLHRLVLLKDRVHKHKDANKRGIPKLINCEFLSQLYDKFVEFRECDFLLLGFSFPMFIMMRLNLLVTKDSFQINILILPCSLLWCMSNKSLELKVTISGSSSLDYA